MQLDKRKKDEELLRKQAEELRRDKIEQQKLQEELKAQIQQYREQHRKQEQEQEQSKPKITTPSVIATPKINYTRSRLQFRLTDGSFFTEDFSTEARMSDVYGYLQETLPTNQYSNGSYLLRTTHTRVVLTRDNPNTLKELDLVPSAVLLVLNRTNSNSPSINLSTNRLFQSIPMFLTWLMMQLNFIYHFIFAKLFGNRTFARSSEQTRPARRTNNSNAQKTTKENFKIDSTEKTTIRRFHNTQDDSDDDEKRTWNGNSTQQM